MSGSIDLTRRQLLVTVPAVGLGWALPSVFSVGPVLAADYDEPSPGPLAGSFPRHDPELVQQVVGFSHAKFEELKPIVEARPTLALATIDWGFGDWETALGAASHVGRRDIAEFLIGHGARPDIFTFAMFGELAVVRAFVEAHPALRQARGPHGISLLQHARNGGDDAKETAEYLESFGDTDLRYVDEALGDEEKKALLGNYTFGPAERDVLVVGEGMGGVTIFRRGGSPRRLLHQGNLAFHPAGAPLVRVEFERGPAGIARVRVTDADIFVTAERAAG